MTAQTATAPREARRSRRALLIALGSYLLPCYVAAGVAGFVIGGIGGRLAMFLLRVTSGPEVIGMESDDGFIIGRFSVGATIELVVFITLAAIVLLAPIHALARLWIPERWRIPVFALLFGIVGSALLVHAEGVDFTLLTPRAFAVGLFVAIPVAFGAVLEPLYALARRLTPRLPDLVLIAIPVLGSAIALAPPGAVIVVLGWGAVLLGYGEHAAAVLRSRPAAWAGRIAMIAVAALAAIFDLARDLNALF